MRLANNDYDNFEAIVDRLITDSAVVSMFYRMDTSISKVAEAWAVISASDMLVYGDFGNQGPSEATFITDFATAVEVTTSIGVTES